MDDRETDFLIADLEQENRLLRSQNQKLMSKKPLKGAFIRALYAKYPDPIEFCRAIEQEHEIV